MPEYTVDYKPNEAIAKLAKEQELGRPIADWGCIGVDCKQEKRRCVYFINRGNCHKLLELGKCMAQESKLKQIGSFLNALGIKPIINIPESEPEIKKVDIQVVEPKQIEAGKPEDKVNYKVTLTKDGLGFRQAYNDSPESLSEFVKKPVENTVDYNPPLDQGGVVGRCVENPMPLSGFIKDGKEADKGILIIRAQGGVGDILNTRMIFEDIKKMAGGRKVTYAVSEKYIPLLTDHPHIDKVISRYDIKKEEYAFVKDITDKCGQYEVKHIPFVDKHRADIWANYVGLDLTTHEQHISFTKEETKKAKKLMGKARLKIGIQPISSNISKDWGLVKWQELVNLIKKTYKGVEVFCYHDKPIEGLTGVTGLYNLNLREWMASVNECNVLLTVATSMFCLANGLHKPTVAIFGSEDLDIYGKYFPEMVAIQRHRKNKDGWDECPCWSAWRNCAKGSDISIENQKIPPCLTSISVDEVMKGFEQCLRNSGLITTMRTTSRKEGFVGGMIKVLSH